MPNSWFYASGNRQLGPVSEPELDSLVDSGVVTATTLVWHQGLANWIAYSAARPERPAATTSAMPPPLEAPIGSAAPEQQSASRFCTQCGRPTPERELAQFGDRVVCLNCKPAFAHELRERGMAPGRYLYAGFWIRVVGRIIDAIILYIVILPVTFLMLGMSAFSTEPRQFETGFLIAQLMVMLFQVVLTAAYDTWFLANYSATPGKMVIGKKVILPDGSNLTYGRALARHLATYVSTFTLGIGYIMAAFDEEKRTLHDRICDTRVVAK